MTKPIHILSLLVGLSLIAPTLASEVDTTQRVYADPSTFGPYGVGVSQLEVRAPHHPGKKLTTLIWYPAESNASTNPYVYIDDDLVGSLSYTAIEDAPLVRGPEPYPVIVFSHGNGGIAYQSVFLTEHLASHGYVVISADHPGNTLFDYKPTSFATGIFTRPRDVTALLDETERMNTRADSDFRGQLDMNRVGITGHSFGGYTALASAGAEINISSATMRCRVSGDVDACRFVAEANKWGPSDEGFIDLSDARIDTAVPLAPWAWEPFKAEGLAKLTVPMQVQGGGLDDTCPMDSQVVPVYDHVSGPRAMLEVYDAGHYAWSDFCELEPDFKECSLPYIDVQLVHDLINTWVTSHFKVYLEEDSRYEVYLGDAQAIDNSDVLNWTQELGL